MSEERVRMEVKVIGGGLAGTEAAFQIARLGTSVTLCEMRPHKLTPAHKTAYLSELVCSNSLKSQDLQNAHGLLKEELRRLGSLVVKIADRNAIAGGKALVVDREAFSRDVTAEIESCPAIRIVREEEITVPDDTAIIATGPLTSDALAANIAELTGSANLHFYDAISPIVDGNSIDMDSAFFASRYSEGSSDYLNCPMTKDEYDLFFDALSQGERVEERSFERLAYFEGCLPIEVMAGRGRETLLYGPMKPVGLRDSTGKRPFAVVQLRREDKDGRMYNLVGFQTKLTYPSQDRVFRLIPALRNARFLRYGSVHRNTYLNAPTLLTGRLNLATREQTFFAGQITGVEGYMESTAMGFYAGLSAAFFSRGIDLPLPPSDTALGSLLRYVITPRENFQPMNINFGLFEHYNKREKTAIVQKALASIEAWKEETDRVQEAS